MARARRLRALSDEDRLFTEWLESADDEILECRATRHLWPGLLDKRTNVSAPKELRRTGRVQVDAYCLRCGTHMVTQVDNGGYLEGSRAGYSYAASYLTPKGSGGAVSRDRRAAVRHELIRRRLERG